MKLSILYTISALTLFPALLEPDRRSGLEFNVVEGTVLRKTFHETTSWSMTEFQDFFDGREQPAGVDAIRTKAAVTVEVLDEYGKTSDGRPTRIARKIEKDGATVETSILAQELEEDYELHLKSPLVDATLKIEWDEEDQDYEITTEEEVESASLEGVEEDMDYRCLLPEEKVSEGEKWKIDAAELAGMLAPGGDWVLLPDGAPRGEFLILSPEDLFACASAVLAGPAEEITGEAIVRWVETRESEGRRLAVISVELKAEISCDLAERIGIMVEESGLGGARDDILYTLDWNLDGKGELLWDLDAGHFESFTLEAESTVTAELSWIEDTGLSELERAIIVDLAATSKLEATAAVEEKE